MASATRPDHVPSAGAGDFNDEYGPQTNKALYIKVGPRALRDDPIGFVLGPYPTGRVSFNPWDKVIPVAFRDSEKTYLDRRHPERERAWAGPPPMPIITTEPPAQPVDLGLKGESYANAQGGKQTRLNHRLDLLPATALVSVARVLHNGAAKYGESNWHKTTVAENLNHALGHALAYLHGDRTEAHLAHFATRALFALYLRIRETGKLDV